MNTTATSGTRALVLGGGGSVGHAWLIGVLAGLAEAGSDPAQADLIIGTSAGSTAAAQIAVADPKALFDEILQTAQTASRGTGNGAPTEHLAKFDAIIADSPDPLAVRRRMGAAALEVDAASDGTGHERWRAMVAARLPSPDWPERTIRVVAVDARTGEPVIFDRTSGVDLVDAIAASCAGGSLPHAIGDGRYVDGGYRSVENADLAAGYEHVLVLSPLGGRTRMPLAWGMHLAAQVETLRSQGSEVQTVIPDQAALEAFGDNLMDLSARPAAARAGYHQGATLNSLF